MGQLRRNRDQLSKYLKSLGLARAQVIRLESTARLESYRSDSVYQNDVSGEFWNKGANFYEQNRNKLGITLDLSQPQGLQVQGNAQPGCHRPAVGPHQRTAGPNAGHADNLVMSAPLEGVRIIEMGQLIAIPFAMKLLADM